MNRISQALAWVKNEILTYPVWAPTVIAGVIAQGTTLSWWHLTSNQTGEVTACVIAGLGIIAAGFTQRIGFAVLVTAAQAVASLSIGFTGHGVQVVGLYTGAVLALIGGFGHAQNSPKFRNRPTGILVGKMTTGRISSVAGTDKTFTNDVQVVDPPPAKKPARKRAPKKPPAA